MLFGLLTRPTLYTAKDNIFGPRSTTMAFHIMLERLVNPKVRAKINWFLIWDTPEHVDSENIKLKIGLPGLYQLDF
jgi:hypothetical protein